MFGNHCIKLYFRPFFREELANFLNKLETHHFVSKTALEKICEEVLGFSFKVHKACVENLTNQLNEMDLPEGQSQILRESLSKNPF
jgi:hypothetical protein